MNEVTIMSLSAIELRIIGSLIEKERTTPEAYPLTTNSLLLACNQKTNRDPISDYTESDIHYALNNMRDKGLIHSTRGANERAFKHQHRFNEGLNLDHKEMAVIAVMMLRGPQTPGELRTRTERYVNFRDLNDVEACLARLESREPALVKNHGRGPGQSQDRWFHTLGSHEDDLKPRVRRRSEENQAEDNQEAMPTTSAAMLAPGSLDQETQKQLRALEAKVNYLYIHLGLSLDDEDNEREI
ncbi:MAG: YceH family protein [Deinococcales bacterium]